MGLLYVARSAGLCKWGSDVGLGKNVFKVGYDEQPAEAVLAALKAGHCGETDWAMVKTLDVEDLTEQAVLDKVARKEKMVDPNLYPRLRGAAGIVRVKIENVENHILMAKALEGQHDISAKIKVADFGTYLINNIVR